MDFERCLFTRRSVRKFDNKPLDDKIIESIITAGIYAPSACNFQAWKFIVVRDEKKKKILKNYILDNAPVCIIVVYRNDLYVTGRKHYDYIQSAAAAIENMLLYAHSIGIGGCWLCHYPKQEKIRSDFHIPDNFDIIGLVALGFPKEGSENTKEQMEYHYGSEMAFKEHKRRFTLEQVICNENFSILEGDCTTVLYPKKMSVLKNTVKYYWKKFFDRGGGKK